MSRKKESWHSLGMLGSRCRTGSKVEKAGWLGGEQELPPGIPSFFVKMAEAMLLGHAQLSRRSFCASQQANMLLAFLPLSLQPSSLTSSRGSQQNLLWFQL